jgi:hypothetical protein
MKQTAQRSVSSLSGADLALFKAFVQGKAA